MSAAQISELAKELGGLSTVLSDATAAERAEVYPSLDLRLDYEPHQRRVKATADFSRVARHVRGGVRGGTCPPTTRVVILQLRR